MDIDREMLDSSVHAAHHALERTRNLTGKHLEHYNKPGYYGQVGISVINRLSTFANLVQKFADVHPYVQAAWTIISSVVNVVTDTQGIDQSVLDLFETLDSTYKFIDDTGDIESHPSYERILSTLAKQTVECAYFIRDYAKKHNFWTRVGKNVFGEPIKQRVQSYQDAFAKLLTEFRSHSALHTEITVGRLLECNQLTSENLDLHNLPYAAAAGLHTGKQCLPGTRVEVLDEIIDWINNDNDNCPRLFWLAGPAGAGKSAIAHSIALRFKSIRRLGSLFCFDRNYSIERRREKVFSTIARDLADLDPQIKSELAKAVKNETSLRSTIDLQLQWEKFILEPLRATSEVSTGPILVVIDALDESGDPISRRELLKILAKEIASLPGNIRFLVTSRPEKDIILTFKSQSHIRAKMMDTIPESEIDHDILTYFRTTLEVEIKEGSFGHVHLRRLVDLSQGLFQWAYLASEFLTGLGNGAGSTATERYQDLIETQHIQSINDPLDTMYNQILSSLFDSKSTRVMSRFRSVIGSIVAASEPLSLNNLVALRGENIPLFGKETDIKVVIQYMGSLLSGIDDPSSTIRPLHLSFREYLLDHDRSREFWIDPSHCHRDFAFGCLRTLMEELRFNICNISNSHIRNIDNESLPGRVSSSIPLQLSYSSRFWALHVSSTTFDTLLARKVEKFLRHGFLLWLEVLSILQAVSVAVRSMSSVIAWCSGKESHETLYNFVVDGKRFVQLFGGAIAESAPHVYISALPFCPQSSIIYKTFINHFPNILRIASEPIHGWPLGQRTIEMPGIQCVCFSHRGQYLAVGLDNGFIKVLDPETLEILWTIELPGEDCVYAVQFSTGDKLLIFATHTSIYSFHILSGYLTLETSFPRVLELSFSQNAKFVALLHDFELIVQNLETKENIINIPVEALERTPSFGFSDVSFITYLGMDIGIQLWNLETGAVLHVPLRPPLPDFYDEWSDHQLLDPPIISPDGRQIIFNNNIRLYIWNFRDNSLITLEGYEPILRSTMTPDGDIVMIRCYGGIILRDMNGNEMHCETTNDIYISAISKDGKRLAISDNSRLNIVELDGWQSSAHIHHSQSTPRYPATPMVVSSDEKYFLVKSTENGYYEICDVESGRPIQKLCLEYAESLDYHSPRSSRDFSPMSRYFGYISGEHAVKICNIGSGTIRNFPPDNQQADVGAIAFSQDEEFIAILDLSQGTIQLWNIDSLKIVDSLTIPTAQYGEPPKFKASSTFQYFAYSFSYGGIFLFSRTQPAPFDFLTSSCEPVRLNDLEDFAFSSDEKYMLISSNSKIFHLNLITNEHRVITLQGNVPAADLRRRRFIYFTRNSDTRLLDITSGLYNIWDAFSGEIIYSVSLEYPDKWIPKFTPIGDQYYFTATKSYRRMLTLDNMEGDDGTCFSSNEQHRLQTHDGSFAKLCSDGWVTARNNEILFWVPHDYHQRLHTSRLKYIVGKKPTELDLSSFVHGQLWTAPFHIM
ncbi:hypothetical protein Clacol_004901 [Clathrus columnatus]|uniref:NACHT domain-containing protein n=1 Tax=Clathrus columnatus TaxID=1419009 RepID=A0AAV5AD93_9AGAM|nr:hypothetical protein Clacol_004901 [Clathrus columnatus]